MANAPRTACWVIARVAGMEAAIAAMHYVAPVGEKEEYVARMMRNVGRYLPASDNAEVWA